MRKEIKWTYINYEDRKKLPKKSGIYCIVTKAEDNPSFLYVGKSINIYSRICAHLPFIKKILRNNPNVVIGYFNTKDIGTLEKVAIEIYTPTNNCTKSQRPRTGIASEVLTALDGRLFRWLSTEVKIPENNLSKKMSGKMDFTQDEIDKINKRLNVNILLK